eukprot:SAG31_NODE_1418_length_8439_cov_20.075540_4_plen_324_part_00
MHSDAKLKGIADKAEDIGMEALSSVNLAKVARKAAGTFSGGMKRRLSVAISLIGSPSVVFMDEPSTGLDPASRKQLWRTVHAAKAAGKCGILLTTHSMQEAEELCDRLCIIRNGKTVVEGTPIELTRSYGDFLQVNVQLPATRLTDVTDLLKKQSPSLSLKEGLGGTQTYELSATETDVHAVFETIAANKENLQIRDWGVQNPSLEDVFVRLYGREGESVQDHEAETPKAESVVATQTPSRHHDQPSCCGEISELGRHSWALMEKNRKIAVRNHWPTLLQLAASFFFMFFVWTVDRAVSAQRQSESRYQVMRTPPRVPVGDIP